MCSALSALTLFIQCCNRSLLIMFTYFFVLGGLLSWTRKVGYKHQLMVSHKIWILKDVNVCSVHCRPVQPIMVKQWFLGFETDIAVVQGFLMLRLFSPFHLQSMHGMNENSSSTSLRNPTFPSCFCTSETRQTLPRTKSFVVDAEVKGRAVTSGMSYQGSWHQC